MENEKTKNMNSGTVNFNFDINRIERLRRREMEKDERRNMLFSLKSSPFSLIIPKFQISNEAIAKCSECKSNDCQFDSMLDRKNFIINEVFYEEPIDMLKMKNETHKWINWMKIECLRYQLKNKLKSVVMHPTGVEILKNLKENSPFPIIFIIEKDNSGINLAALKFILMTIDFDVENVLEISMIKEKMSSLFKNKINRHFIMILENDKEKNLIEILRITQNILLLPVAINSELYDDTQILQKSHLGLLKLNISEPYIAKDMLKNYSHQSDKRISSIIDHIKVDLMLKQPVMCTNVVSFIMLKMFKETEATMENICNAFDKICNKNIQLDFAFQGNSQDIVNYAISLLDNLIIVDDKVFKVSDDNEKIEQLLKYSETLSRHFALQAIVLNTALNRVQRCHNINQNSLIDEASSIVARLGKTSLLIRPCQELRTTVVRKVEYCISEGLLKEPFKDECDGIDDRKAKNWLRNMGISGDSDDSDDEDYKKNIPETQLEINTELKHEIDFIKLSLPTIDQKDPSIESIIVIAAKSLSKTSETFTKENLLDKGNDLAELFNNEVFFSFHETEIKLKVEDALDRCFCQNLLIKTENSVLKLNVEKQDEIDKLGKEILPLIDSYLTVAYMLYNLLYKPYEMSVENFINGAMKSLKEDLEDGKAQFPESLCEVKMKNCLKHFKDVSIVKIEDEIVSLNDEEDEDSIEDVITDIKNYFIIN